MGRGRSVRPMPEVSAVVVTYNAAPWIERSLDSLRGTEAEVIVVDNGSTDGTLELVREKFPEARLLEEENRGFGAGNNAGMRVASGRYFLLLNPDAWLTDGALEQLVAFADEHPEAAVVGPRLLNPDGSLQRSVRGYPTAVADRHRVLLPAQARSPLARAQRVLRRELRPRVGARGRVPRRRLPARAARGGRLDRRLRRGLLPDERGGRLVLPLPAGGVEGALLPRCGGRSTSSAHRSIRRSSGASCADISSSSRKHRGARVAERARRVMLWGLRFRGLLYRGERGRAFRDTARWLGSGKTATLLESPR